MIHITKHALERAIERIPQVRNEEEAREALRSPTVLLAIEIGAPFVKLGTGQHIVIDRGSIITVLPADHHPSSFTRNRDALHHRGA